MSNKLDKILGAHEEGALSISGPRYCSVWYNTKTGTIYGFGDSNPVSNNPKMNQRDISQMVLSYDELGARPELHLGGEPTPVQRRVFRQIALYRQRVEEAASRDSTNLAETVASSES